MINFLLAMIAAGTPLLFGTVGEILTEKTGHLNLGVEGIMAMGACAGFMVGYATDNFLLALICAFLAGAGMAFIYALLTVTLMANQNVIGLTMTIFGVGLSNFIGFFVLNKSSENSLKLPEQITESMRFSVGGINIFTYIAIAIAIILFIYTKSTMNGLNLKAIGENPDAANAAGIHVNGIKYLAIALGGGICGLGGVYCAFIINGGVWTSNGIAGLGWISVALVIFASWNFLGAIVGSMFFGALRILKYYIPTGIFPLAFYDMLPFLVTAIILIVASMRKKGHTAMPQNLGNNYKKSS
ncbi:putative deoxyribose-specific ABC transporter, permease protein [Lachnospiraceae bacterium TWA4]|nr:putative deoxyribose-specific ABC transporter, permease protein [Lachnospiraceae bacterium TWA4]